MTIEMLTPNIGTGAMEDRERIDYRSLRATRHDRVTALMDRLGLDALMRGRHRRDRSGRPALSCDRPGACI
jgi:hypothetical protein